MLCVMCLNDRIITDCRYQLPRMRRLRSIAVHTAKKATSHLLGWTAQRFSPPSYGLFNRDLMALMLSSHLKDSKIISLQPQS